WSRAVVPRADRDALRVQHGRDVVWMDTLEREGEHGEALLEVLGTEQTDPLDLRQPLHRMACELLLPGEQRVMADPIDIVAGGSQADGAGRVGRARLELVRHFRPGRALHRDGID